MDNTQVKICKVRLRQASCPVEDLPAKVRLEFSHIEKNIRPNMRIAITAGSRGVANIALVIKTVVECLKERGASPFIIPAMGSHGGATAEGQRAVLEGYGITEEYVGAPICSSLKVQKIDHIDDPNLNVYMDRFAWESDGVIAINRVKVHTDFHGAHESGIVKMLTIGLGKHAQALAVHHYGANGLRDYIPMVTERVIRSGKVLGAIALLEDGYDHTADVKAALPEEIFEVDHEFLERSRSMFAQLPFREIDSMIVDRMGKEISGTGMDPNVIGRIRIDGQQDGFPHVKRLAVLDLSDGSHGNAIGVGLADIATRRLAGKIDWKATNENVITSGFLSRGFLPVVAENDRQAVALTMATCGIPVTEDFRLVRIRDTLHLSEAYVSPALLKELTETGRGEQIGEFRPIEFDSQGNITPF